MREKAQILAEENSSDEQQYSTTVKPPDERASQHKSSNKTMQEIKWKRIANWSLAILASLFIVYFILNFISADAILSTMKSIPDKIDERFFWMLGVGFAAQLVDGALGMGYGVISTTLLLSGGINPVVVSGSIHTAEMFSSGASGYSHYKFGNVNKKLFKTLLIPGVIGAVCGAFLLGFFGEKYAGWLRPVLSIYTLILGVRILINAFKKSIQIKKVKNAGWLAGAGGFLDSFGGGGWGPLVTSTLISKGRSPKYVIGSVSLTEFFVTFASAITFFIILGISHIDTILGLIVGGLLAAPIAAQLAGKLPVKKMFLGVGIIVIISSIRIIWTSIF